MSHEVETMMYANAVPWHGLGVKVDDTIGTEEAIVKAGLDWQVETTPCLVQFQGDDGSIIEREAPAKATIRVSDNSILGVVGPDYSVLQNKVAFKFFDRFLAAGHCTLEAAGSLREGKRVWVLAKIKGDPIDIVKGDPIEKYLLLSNSHDGTLAIRVGFTPIRVVCANTLAMAIGIDRETNKPMAGNAVSRLLRVQHRGNVNGALDDIGEIIDLINRQFGATAEQFKILAAHSIAEGDLKKYVKLVFKPAETKDERRKRVLSGDDVKGGEAMAFDDEDTHGDKVYNRIAPLFESGRGNDLPGVRGTWWAAYNAITEFTSHVRGKDAAVRLESQWTGDGARINQKALATAMTLVAGSAAN